MNWLLNLFQHWEQTISFIDTENGMNQFQTNVSAIHRKWLNQPPNLRLCYKLVVQIVRTHVRFQAEVHFFENLVRCFKDNSYHMFFSWTGVVFFESNDFQIFDLILLQCLQFSKKREKN